MNSFDLTGQLWSQAREELRELGFEDDSLRVQDITPERTPRTPTQSFGWGQERVVRARIEGGLATVTIAREMKL